MLGNQQINQLLSKVDSRNRDILKRRFGLGRYNETHTLQKIGDFYDLTRERIRQIEESSLAKLRKANYHKDLFPALTKVKKTFKKNQEFIPQKQLVPKVVSDQYLNELLFVLKLGKEFFFFSGDQILEKLWTLNPERLKQVRQYLTELTKELENRGQVLPADKIKKDFPLSYIEPCKVVEVNPFGEVGLKKWPRISPPGARDKACLILEKENRPMHYEEIAKKIKKIFSNSRIPMKETVHNELIKDDRFVLQGEGVYSLKN